MPPHDHQHLVIFDCDGVLIDSEAIACAVEATILQEIGHPITLEDFTRRFVGTTRAHSLAALATDWGRELPPDYVEIVRMARDARFRAELKAIAKMPELIVQLAPHSAVASSSSQARLAMTLGLTGLHDIFEGRIFSAEQVAHGKPAPDLFLLAAQEMGVNPSACYVVEDSCFGIEAACAAGIIAIGFTAGSHCGPDHGATLTRAGARVICSSAAELRRYLEESGVVASDAVSP